MPEICCKGCVTEIEFFQGRSPQSFKMKFFECRKGEVAGEKSFPLLLDFEQGPNMSREGQKETRMRRYEIIRGCKNNCWWLEICWTEENGRITAYGNWIEGVHDPRCCPERQ